MAVAKTTPVKPMSKETRRNWLIDAAVALGGLAAALTGIYFLFLPVGGYQGGRNPTYDITILFARHTWDDVHTWGGALMIAAVFIHFLLHWNWVSGMARRIWKSAMGAGTRLSRRGYVNVAIDLAVAISFLLAAISGVYFMFVTGGRWASDPMFVFSRTTWDLIHTWSGTIMIMAAVVHFAIHWKWVTKVTRNTILSTWGSLLGMTRRPAAQPVPVASRDV